MKEVMISRTRLKYRRYQWHCPCMVKWTGCFIIVKSTGKNTGLWLSRYQQFDNVKRILWCHWAAVSLYISKRLMNWPRRSKKLESREKYKKCFFPKFSAKKPNVSQFLWALHDLILGTTFLKIFLESCINFFDVVAEFRKSYLICCPCQLICISS